MTNREAIKVLNGTMSLLLQSKVNFWHIEDFKMAKDLAIKALEKESDHKEEGND